MIKENVWQFKKRKKASIHQMRERRSCEGELVQIDGSPHDWFEGRREECCLLVYVDDATGKIKNLRFEEGETCAGYFKTTLEYINQFGLPLAWYTDKDSIFKNNTPEKAQAGETQFARAMRNLGIKIFCANSPQAKGRGERMNGILQDRLVKELRLRNISNLETANMYLPEFIDDYNSRFAVVPKSPVDAHRSVVHNESELTLILSFQYERVLSKNLELSFKNVIYQIQTVGQGYGLRYAKVAVCEDMSTQSRNVPLTSKVEMSPW